MSDKKKYSLSDVEDIQFRMSCGIDAVWAIHNAMVEGSCTPESYTDALYGAYDYLRILNKELAETIDRMRAERKVGAA